MDADTFHALFPSLPLTAALVRFTGKSDHGTPDLDAVGDALQAVFPRLTPMGALTLAARLRAHERLGRHGLVDVIWDNLVCRETLAV